MSSLAAWKRVCFCSSTTVWPVPRCRSNTRRRATAKGVRSMWRTGHVSQCERLAWQVPAVDPDSSYLFVFNPHAWSTTQNIEYDLGLSDKDPYEVEDAEGAQIPFQWVQATTAAQGRRRLVAQVHCRHSAIGRFASENLCTPAAATSRPTPSLKTGENLLENNSLRVTFSPEGMIGIFDKVAGREVFHGGKTGARAVVFSDQNDTWAHNLVAYTDEIGSFKAGQHQAGRERPTARAHARSLCVWKLCADDRLDFVCGWPARSKPASRWIGTSI